MVITIDGPAGAGKSTIAKILAKRLDFMYLDTGAMYRALTFKAIENNLDLDNSNALIHLAEKVNICLTYLNNGNYKVFVDNQDVSDKIRTPVLTQNVFKIARIPKVRDIMVQKQREYRKSNNVVMEGRDIGTVVFPDAEIKFYLDADPLLRAKRRFKELKEKGMKSNLQILVEEINQRDLYDKNREHGPLKVAADAVIVDTTNLNIQEVVENLLRYIYGHKK